MPRIVIVGGGYAGFYTAWKLEHTLAATDAELVVVDPRPYMTYQPFLPEVCAGSIEARHAAVSLRTHLTRTRLVAGEVTQIDHAHKRLVVRPAGGADTDIGYDIVVVTAGAVTRRSPIPGLDAWAIGLKHVEEAVAIRDHIITSFDRASAVPAGDERRRLLTFVFVGAGFSGVEGFGETLSLAAGLLRRYPEIDPAEPQFHLVEARDHILPEVTVGPERWVLQELRRRGAQIHLGAHVLSADDHRVVLSTGEQIDASLLVWTAGNAPNPVISTHTDLPLDERGRLVVRPDLRVGTDDDPVEDAWAGGDNAAVPDLSAATGSAITVVPNAQNAVRQGKLLAANIAAHLRGKRLRRYRHRSLGVVATLGLGSGIFQYRRLVVHGLLAWLMHRGYHVLAIPTWERKVRVLAVWLTALVGGRDIVPLSSVQDPRAAYLAGGVPHARRPQPSADAVL
jgi:NADH dehydrogenase